MESAKQWIGVLFTMSLYVFPLLVSTPLVLILLFSPLWFLPVAYFTWAFYFDKNASKTGGRRSNYFRQLPVFKWYCEYFPIKLVKTAELDPSKNYIMGYHPHGQISLGCLGNFGGDGNEISNVFKGLTTTVLTMDFFFWFPIVREMALAGGLCNVSKESINYLMAKESGGNAAILIPGGAREVMYAEPGTDVIYLKDRKGFIKVAIQNGASLVPIYSFGETDLYRQPSKWIVNIQKWIWDTLQFFPFILLGRWNSIMPQKVPITSVVGAPIPVEKTPNPTNEEVDAVHQKYMDALKILYYEHREKYGNPKSELIIT